MTKSLVKPWYKQGLLLFGVCVSLGLLLQYGGALTELNETWIDRSVRGNGFLGGLYFVTVCTLVTACGVPRQLVAFLGGYAFGFSIGTILAMIATVLGCASAFYAARWIGRPFVVKQLRKQADYVDHFLKTQPIQKTIAIRFFPVGSNLVTNILAGLTSVKPLAFFTGSVIGYLPQTIIFSLLGKGLLIGAEWKIAISFLLLLISSYFSYTLAKKHKIARLLQSDSSQPSSSFTSTEQS